MKKSWIKRAALAGALLIATANLAFADIARPDKNSDKSGSHAKLTTDMRIQTDEKAKEAKLIIPREIWQQMKMKLDGNGSQNAGTLSSFFNMRGGQTVISGIFLSLAFAFGGVWLVRSRKAAGKLSQATALGAVLLLVCGLTAGLANANAGPPPVARSLTSNILLPELQWWGATGQVKVEISDEENEITLVLPKTKPKDKDE